MYKTTSDIKTTSLESSKRLKELGIGQRYSSYFWAKSGTDDIVLLDWRDEELFSKENRWAAFTREELAALLGFGELSNFDDSYEGYLDYYAVDVLIYRINNETISLTAANNRLHRYRCPDAEPFHNVPLNEHAGFHCLAI